jgi:chemotaxis protein MotB
MMFVSLNIILLAFFIVLNSIAILDEKRIRLALGSLLGTFGILEGGLSPFPSDARKTTLPSPPIVPIPDYYNYLILENLEEFIRQMQFSKEVGLLLGGGGISIHVSEPILFDPGQSELKPEVRPLLLKAAEFLNQIPGPIRVEGHTDDRPVTEGPYRSNWDLSIARASVAARFLIDQGSVKPRRISVAGYADSKPLVPNDSPEQLKLNNRLRIFVEVATDQELESAAKENPAKTSVEPQTE